jgi:hypothetical protein
VTLLALPRLLTLVRMVAVALSLALAIVPARAADIIETVSAGLTPNTDSDGGWVLSADFRVPLPDRLAQLVEAGIALHFTVDFELHRTRWYWWNDRVVQASRTARLSYHALTRQYRLSSEGLQQSFPSFADAVQAMSIVRGWKVVDAGTVRADVEYEAYVRMRLDTSQLPKPFQVTAITNRDWNIQAEWKRFAFNPEMPKSAQ